MFLFASGGGEHPVPLIVKFVNHYLGEPVYRFQMAYTRPTWVWIFEKLGVDSTPEQAFGVPYSPETAIPWYTVMFVIACLLSVATIWVLKGKLSEDDPSKGQLTLEAGFLAVKDLIVTVVGEHGYKYFPVVATFAVLVLVSNLMGQFPLFMSPTAHVNVTFALGIASFVYYNSVGIRENGLINHLAHFAGPKLPLIMAVIMTPLIFTIELVSNMIRPMTLGLRLFANMFADEQIAYQAAHIFEPFSQYLFPILVMPLAVFVAFVQTLVFTLLSMIYISEVSHPHDEHEEHAEIVAVAEDAAAESA
ncbi:MAG: F0F1 ATP synthase subunit A [Acidobacteriota bacterium]|nr:F0F1 ATP synthase subunit A [Acidobacteriota bacterium]